MYWNVQSYLVTLIFFVVTIWYVIFLWKRRKLYIYSWNIPGPLSLPFVGMAYKFFGRYYDIVEIIEDIVSQYPPVIKLWFGPVLLYSLTEPEHIKKVLMNPKCLEKAYVYKFIGKHMGDGLFTSLVPRWKKHRRLIMPSFNQRMLDSFVEVFVEQATIFTEVLKMYSGRKDIDISVPVNAMMMDTIGETALGLKINTQGGKTNLAEHFDKCLEITTLQIFNVWYHIDLFWNLSHHKTELEKSVHAIDEFLIKIINEKLLLQQKRNKGDTLKLQNKEDEGKTRLAFLDTIMQDTQFTDEDLMAELKVFFAAGTDTTAMTTCFCFEMLGVHQEVQQKVYEEAIEILGENRPVEASDLPSFKYMERVIKETLRLFPVGVFLVRENGEDMELGNYVIPKGACILFSSLNIHRNPKYWPDPLRFDPDRFLPEEVIKCPTCSYIPFSYGPRNCIGNKYAMMSMTSIIATTIRRYKVFSGYKSVENIKQRTAVLSRPKYGFKVYLEDR